jgi:hypothetical protein
LENNTQLLIAVDYSTVRALQLRVPGISKVDHDEIHALFDKKTKSGEWEIYATCSAESRTRIRQKVLSAKERIPSINTFFEDLKYMEPLANCMKILIGPAFEAPSKMSIRTCFQLMYEGENFDTGYRELWLYAMRNFPQMVSVAPRKENKRPKPTIWEPEHRLLCEFGQMAFELGFRSEKIMHYVEQVPEVAIARDFFLRTRPQGTYSYQDSFLEPEVAQLVLSLQKFSKRPSEPPSPLLSASCVEIARRSGRPFESDHSTDKRFLFLCNMENRTLQHGGKEDISTFFCKRSFYLSFFVGLETISNDTPIQTAIPVSTSKSADLTPAPPSNQVDRG